MARILGSGKNIMTPVGFVYPPVPDPADVATLANACRRGGSSLYGAGIHPGFSGDLLPRTQARTRQGQPPALFRLASDQIW